MASSQGLMPMHTAPPLASIISCYHNFIPMSHHLHILPATFSLSSSILPIVSSPPHLHYLTPICCIPIKPFIPIPCIWLYSFHRLSHSYPSYACCNHIHIFHTHIIISLSIPIIPIFKPISHPFLHQSRSVLSLPSTQFQGLSDGPRSVQ